jgi:hypothetical protein
MKDLLWDNTWRLWGCHDGAAGKCAHKKRMTNGGYDRLVKIQSFI